MSSEIKVLNFCCLFLNQVVGFKKNKKGDLMQTVLLVLLILLLIGAWPMWPYSLGWGYGPSGILFVILIVVLVLALTGRGRR